MICAHSGPWTPGIQAPILYRGAPLRAPNAHPEAPHRPPTSGGRLSRRGAASPRRGRARSRLRCRCAPLHVREGFGENRPRSALRGERARYECKGSAGIYMERMHGGGAVVWGSRGGVRQQSGPCGGRHLGRPHGALGHGRSTPTRAPVGETEDMQEYLRFRPVLLRLHVRPEPTYSGRTIAATFVHCARATGTCEGSKRG